MHISWESFLLRPGHLVVVTQARYINYHYQCSKSMLFYLAVYREKILTQIFPGLDRAHEQRYELCVKKHSGINTPMPAI
jgi:hypothetical protein